MADLLISKQVMVLNPRGTVYSSNNMKQVLGIRNMNESLRGGGLVQGGPGQITAKEIQNFSNYLDKMITQHAGL